MQKNHKKYSEMFQDIERQFFKDEDEKPTDLGFSFAVNSPVEMQTKILKRETFEPPVPVPIKKSNASKVVEDLYSKTIQKHSAHLPPKVGQKRPMTLTQTSPFNLETSKRAKFADSSETKQFIPFVQQVKDSFTLRPDNYLKDMINLELEQMINPC